MGQQTEPALPFIFSPQPIVTANMGLPYPRLSNASKDRWLRVIGSSVIYPVLLQQRCTRATQESTCTKVESLQLSNEPPPEYSRVD